MKKLILFVCLFVAIGISANVMAQGGTKINPQVGSVHTYSVNAAPGGHTYSYAWKVTENEDFAAADPDLLNGTVVDGTSTTNSIELTWKQPDVATNKIYYLHVEVTEGSCKNNKVLAIQPVNSFALELANVGSDNTVIADDFSDCPAAVISSNWTGTPAAGAVNAGNATSFTYNYGVNTFYYKVRASGINTSLTDWTAKFDLTHSSTGTVTAFYGTTAAGAATPLTVGAAGTPTANSVTITTGVDNFYIKVVVTNATDEGTTARTVNVNLNQATSVDEFGNAATSIIKNNLTQTINARPDVGNIH